MSGEGRAAAGTADRPQSWSSTNALYRSEWAQAGIWTDWEAAARARSAGSPRRHWVTTQSLQIISPSGHSKEGGHRGWAFRHTHTHKPWCQKNYTWAGLLQDPIHPGEEHLSMSQFTWNVCKQCAPAITDKLVSKKNHFHSSLSVKFWK